MTNLRIISCGAHEVLAKAIADQPVLRLHAGGLVGRTLDEFQDHETRVQIEDNVRGCDVYVIQPTCPPANHTLMELLITVDALRRASAHHITAVMPFFGYARQDRKDRPRVPITAKLVANLLVAAGVQRVLTLDLHAAQIQGFFDIPADNLEAMPVFVPEIRALNLRDLVIVTPDIGGIKRAKSYAAALGAKFAIVDKDRISDEKVRATALIGEVENCEVLIVDDMTETAGTVVEAAKLLEEQGAKRIFAAVTHGVLSGKGRDRIANSPIELMLVTDSVPQAHGKKVRAVSVAPLLAEAIARTHFGESVTRLFQVPALAKA
ncbi:MAG TPA: ribose-phosphate pyrophosphokinase [Candidatus Paceibacterota bacterium]